MEPLIFSRSAAGRSLGDVLQRLHGVVQIQARCAPGENLAAESVRTSSEQTTGVHEDRHVVHDASRQTKRGSLGEPP